MSDLEARVAELRDRIGRLDRVRLAHLPTPLDFCPRLTEALGGPKIYVKRDDMTGLAFGGNKTRQLEFLFADILKSGADTIVAGAYTQSNWCRQITAAAAKQGLRVSLVLVHGVKGPARQGNLLLDYLMGADVEIVDIPHIEDLAPYLEAKVTALADAGRRPYLISPLATEILALSAVGYVDGMAELAVQMAERGFEADAIYLSAANATPAGYALGAKALGLKTRVVGVTPIHFKLDRQTDIAAVAGQAARLLGLDCAPSADEIINDDGYVGAGYGIVSPEGRRAMKLVAETEGLFLDPVYSSKAMAALIDHIETGRVGADETVVFLHTGGTPALFAYADDMDI